MLKKAKNPQNIWSFQKKAVPLHPNMYIRARKSVEYLLNDITWYKMNRSLNVFFGLVVCGGLIAGLFIWTKRSVSDECVFNPHDFYNSIGGSSYSTGSSSVVSGATDGGWTVPMRSSSSMFRHRGASSYAPAYSAPNSPIASSPYRLDASASPLYTTSSATMKSFGGGNAMGGGVSMSGGAVSSAPIAYSQSPIASSPITYSPSPIASSPVVNNQASGMEQYAAASTYDGIGNTTNGPRGIRGRRNGGIYDSWLEWLYRYGTGYGSSTSDEEGNMYYTFNIYQLNAAYEAFRAYYDEMWGTTPPDFDTWYAWFLQSGEEGYNYKNANFKWQPIGDAWPLLAIALLYALVMIFRKKLGRPTDC